MLYTAWTTLNVSRRLSPFCAKFLNSKLKKQLKVTSMDYDKVFHKKLCLKCGRKILKRGRMLTANGQWIFCSIIWFAVSKLSHVALRADSGFTLLIINNFHPLNYTLKFTWTTEITAPHIPAPLVLWRHCDRKHYLNRIKAPVA